MRKRPRLQANRFRFLAFRDPKLNVTRPTRTQWPQVFGQVSEKTVISGRDLQRRPLRQVANLSFVPVCEAPPSKLARQPRHTVSIEEWNGAKKRALFMNQVRRRVHLHTGQAHSGLLRANFGQSDTRLSLR
ncbi:MULTISPECIES: hypothetical protein [unclassified Bradyrhizobium]|uniref:hypothetical protein n=1 Tax=unclassified Bradyrhizobium TaxID=2631580 RepID=UPI00247930FE|nr:MULTISPECIES: hypothetical protein [unclassified Bradyrhizobium]WGR71992.1 hypothetical protein MTX24_03230 [Bradyrhizobium sp. ISRA426]WGR76826.1 hypothetical protein MTX21_28180 [Bradyrhizobium sp. ISRA430]WGR87231.1 hypothetical protein MTX25_03230 [Bradyrhizobium sp. ISRA432]